MSSLTLLAILFSLERLLFLNLDVPGSKMTAIEYDHLLFLLK